MNLLKKYIRSVSSFVYSLVVLANSKLVFTRIRNVALCGLFFTIITVVVAPHSVIGLKALIAFGFVMIFFLSAQTNKQCLVCAEKRKLNTFIRVLDTVSEGITLYGADKKYIYSNLAAAKMLGFQSVESLLKAKTDGISNGFKAWDNSGNVISNYDFLNYKNFNYEQSSDMTIRMQDIKTGEETWRTIKSIPLVNGQNKLDFSIQLASDITEKKISENKLKFLAEIGQILSSSIDYYDRIRAFAKLCVPFMADWCIVDILEENQKLSRLAAANADSEKIRLSYELYNTYPPDPSHPVGVYSVIKSEKTIMFSNIADSLIKNLSKDKKHYEMLKRFNAKAYMCVPLLMRDRKIGAVSLVMSESNRMFTQKDVVFAEDVCKRAAVAIDNARLYSEAKKVFNHLNDSVKVKDQFIANVSHEIRTPLNGIMGTVDLLTHTSLNENQNKLVHILNVSSHTLLDIVNSILDFSKIESGKIELDSIDFSLLSVVTNQVELLRAKANQKGVELDFFISPGIPSVLNGDPGRLSQILLNIIGNAIKFTNRGKIYIHGMLDDVSQNLAEIKTKVKLRFMVSDTGIGLTELECEKIFQPFTQADPTIGAKYGGTGLGLTICKHLVEIMGGQIGVESKKDHGSKFWFTLNFATTQLQEEPKKEMVKDVEVGQVIEEKSGGDIKKEKQKKILVVEDNAINQLVTRQQLAILGYEPHSVTSGKAAIAAIANASYDLVLMDCMMPELDGFKTTRLIRSLEMYDNEKNNKGASNRMPIIALTAYNRKQDIERCLEFGMDDYISKPTNIEQLGNVIKRHLPN
ncbi:MAG: response regulator [Deltaproteobacteria bacterium]|nr:response regulator [Deltaproteobacteria bacterium]